MTNPMLKDSPAWQLLSSETAKTRLEQLLEVSATMLPEVIEEVFLSERVGPEGPSPESFWFFTRNYLSEAKNPINETRFDICLLTNNIKWVEITAQGFDFKKADEGSQLSVVFSLVNDISGRLNASGLNCMNLMQIAKSRLFANAQRHSRDEPSSSP